VAVAGFGLATEAAILASLLLSGALAAPPSLAEPPAGSARRSRDALVVLTVEHPGEGAVVQRALADAELLRQAVVVSLGVSTRRVSVLADPTRDVVDKELARAIGRVRSRGVLWVVVLGRGSSTALELADGSLALQEIADLGLATRADQVVMLADVRTDGGDRADPEALRPVAAPAWVKGDPRLVWWGADDAGVPAIWSAAGHGVFPWLVAGALRGWADGALGEPDGAVTLTEAMQYVATTTPALGYLQRSSVDARPEVAALVISEGPIEASPTAASLAEWATADRADRRGERARHVCVCVGVRGGGRRREGRGRRGRAPRGVRG
jgi:hypothetical protein